MHPEENITAFAKLGKLLRNFKKNKKHSALSGAVSQSIKYNGWFTEKNVLFAVHAIGEMLQEDKIREWMSKHPVSLSGHRKMVIGVIMAGNIPLAGFHDFLSVLFSGNVFLGKLSSDDRFLLPAFSELLTGIDKRFKEKIFFVPADSFFKKGASAFIATGSSNSARYFEYYFRHVPHIIRKNRNSVAVLDGSETETDIKNLGKDIFQYFGLGCRNVSKVFIPQNYNPDKIFSAIADYGNVIHHHKYCNNYRHYRSMYLLNKETFLDNNFLLLKEDKRMASPPATLYFERYENKSELFRKLEEEKTKIQCIVSKEPLPSSCEKTSVMPGQTQSPALWDYADGTDTMEFLCRIFINGCTNYCTK